MKSPHDVDADPDNVTNLFPTVPFSKAATKIKGPFMPILTLGSGGHVDAGQESDDFVIESL
jgi:hypothetical protein